MIQTVMLRPELAQAIVSMGWIEPWAKRLYRGELYDREVRTIAYFAQKMNAKKIFEIGTFRGRTALALSQNTNAEVFTLDVEYPPKDMELTDAYFVLVKEEIGSVFQSVNQPGITQLWGDSRTFDFSPYYGQIDVMLIDGAHDYKTVLSDLRNAEKMARLIFCHDFASHAQGCVQAISEFTEDRTDAVFFAETMLVGIGELMEELI